MYEELKDKLYKVYVSNGFITEKILFDAVQKDNIPLYDIEYICDQLLAKGVIIRENSFSVNEHENDQDRSIIDYDLIYKEVIEKDISLKPFVEYVKSIHAPQHRECQNLIPKAKNGNKQAKIRIFQMYMRVALKLALDFSNQYSQSIADSIQNAMIGLYISIDKFDFSKHESFPRYFPIWVRQTLQRKSYTLNPLVYFPAQVKEKAFQIYDIVKEHNCGMCSNEYICSDILNQISDKIGMNLYNTLNLYRVSMSPLSLEQLFEDGNFDIVASEDYSTEIKDINRIINKVIENVLNEKEQFVIKHRFGFINNHNYTLEEVGKLLNVTRERVRQVEAVAIRKLRTSKILKEIDY